MHECLRSCVACDGQALVLRGEHVGVCMSCGGSGLQVDHAAQCALADEIELHELRMAAMEDQTMAIIAEKAARDGA